VVNKLALVWLLAALVSSCGRAEAQAAQRQHLPLTLQRATSFGLIPTPAPTAPLRPDSWGSREPLPTGRNGLALAMGRNGKLYAIGGSTIEGSAGATVATVEEYDPVADRWTARAPMPTPRFGAAAVAHGNGLIYVIGGSNESGFLATVDAYDPTSDAWSSRAPMTTARHGLAAAQTPDGYIVAGGGYNGSEGYLTSVDRYDPDLDEWGRFGALRTARAYFGLAVAGDGKAYAVGGSAVSASGGGYFASVEVADTLSGAYQFMETSPMPTARHGLALAVTAAGTVLAIGGYNPQDTYVRAVEEYDPDADRWVARAPVPAARASLAAARGEDGRIFVAGGTNASGARLTAFEVYDPAPPAGDTWAVRSASQVGREGVGAALGSTGKIYLVGGASPGGQVATIQATNEEYDPDRDVWQMRAPMPSARAYLGVAAAGGRVYAAGGLEPGSRPVAYLDEYDPATDSWQRRADMPTARTGPTLAAGPDGRLYAIGGFSTAGGYLTTLERYDPAGDAWVTLAPMPTARSGLAAAFAANGRLYAVGGSRTRDVVGQPAFDPALTVVEEYDPATDSWRARAPMPTPRQRLGLAAGANGRLYAAGGVEHAQYSENFYPAFLSRLEEYDPSADAWISRGGMRTAQAAHGLVGAPNGFLYALGGRSLRTYGTSIDGLVQEYRPS
jgi:N-acetylneuraminic acid mutarotase